MYDFPPTFQISLNYITCYCNSFSLFLIRHLSFRLPSNLSSRSRTSGLSTANESKMCSVATRSSTKPSTRSVLVSSFILNTASFRSYCHASQYSADILFSFLGPLFPCMQSAVLLSSYCLSVIICSRCAFGCIENGTL